MKKTELKLFNNVDLRRRAESSLQKKKSGSIEQPEKKDLQFLLHELQVHQIELEIQNEDLRVSRTETEELLNRYIELYEFSPAGCLTFNKDGRIMEANLTSSLLLGMERSLLVGKYFNSFVIRDTLSSFNSFLETVFEGKGKEECEIKLRNHKNGQQHDVIIQGIYVEGSSDKNIQCRCTVMDITAKKQAEVLKTSLQEKDLLLKEVHHRVGNNLQLILSLLTLQSASVKDDKLREYFREIDRRIRSISLVHDHLSQSEKGSKLNFGNYVETISKEIFYQFGHKLKSVALETEIGNIELQTCQAVSCGLIINEILTNAFKYAFPPDYSGKGRVRISLHLMKDNFVEINISDNGVGIPDEINIDNPGSAGLSIIFLLVKQMKGEIRVDRSKGTAYLIKFPM